LEEGFVYDHLPTSLRTHESLVISHWSLVGWSTPLDVTPNH